MAPRDQFTRSPSSSSTVGYDSLEATPEKRSPSVVGDDGQQTLEQSPVSNEYVLNVATYSFVAFVVFQTIFALIAHSQSMLADSEAMAVDALTYLFNLTAERMKNRPRSAQEELELSPAVLSYRRTLEGLYLELVPPLVSVVTLIFVTVMTLRESFTTLFDLEDETAAERSDDDVSVRIMLLFSGSNLLLDAVNITCFARAHSAVVDMQSLEPVVPTEYKPLATLPEYADEETQLLSSASSLATHDDDDEHLDEPTRQKVNLNMCSAWTHVCADTLRSIAVLIAAALATFVPGVQGDMADAVAAIVVSFIIFGSLLPLLRGLYKTIIHITQLVRNPPTSSSSCICNETVPTTSATGKSLDGVDRV